MLSENPGTGAPQPAYAPPVPPAPPAAPAPGAPPPKKPPIALFVVLAVLALCVLCSCLGLVAANLFDYDPDPGSNGEIGPSGGDDQQVIDGGEAIARACEEYAADNGTSPSTDAVWQGGELGYYLSEWPENPYTGDYMQPGSGPGEYEYHTATSMGDGQEYLGYIYVYLSDGSQYSIEYEY